MRYLSPALIMMATLTLSAPAAHAVPITFTASLSGANEVPAVDTAGAGSQRYLLIQRPIRYRSTQRLAA
jgi:hypothetical protein